MTTIEEGTFTLKDGLKVYTKSWKVESPVAAVIFLHGFSDHSNAYYDFFPYLAKRGIDVFSFDQRGWGQSSLIKKQWGVTGGTTAILKDLDEIIATRIEYLKTLPTVPPLYLVGHSAGGGITLTYAYSGSLRSELSGYVAFSPFIRIAPAEKPNPVVLRLGKLASHILPNFPILNKLDPSAMSRDSEVCKTFADDKLCHDTGTLLGISEMFDRGKYLLDKTYVSKFDKKKPVLVLHGTGDKVTDFTATKEFYGLLDVEDKEFKELEGWYHKMHADRLEDREVFSGYVADWILEKVEKKKQGDVEVVEGTSA